MELVVDLSTREVVVRDESDLKRFAVRALTPRGGDVGAAAFDQLSEVLDAHQAGSVSDGDVLVAPDVIRSLAAQAASGHGTELDGGWDAEFASMLEYATSKGWIQDGMVCAHVEWGN